MKFQPTRIALLVSGLFLAAGAHAQSTTDVGTINVEGKPGGTDTGLIQPEDSAKSRSSVDRDYISKQGPTSNAYQLINLLPGVSSFGTDATGIYGGGIRVRGFNSDQMGFTVNGVPINDSGSFTVFPQEYQDPENICSVFVTQGSTDTDAPHVGASGGNIGIQSCQPKDQLGGLYTSTIGSDSLRRNFIRLDSGKFLNDMAKFYISTSHTDGDKFRGAGGYKKDHVDAGARFDFGKGSYIDADYLYNRAIVNNYRLLTKQDIEREGYYADYGTVAPIHATPGPGAQSDTTVPFNVANQIFSATGPNASQRTADGYYGLSLNPFRNYIANLSGHWQVAPQLSADVQPYFWYGYGTGANELFTFREGATNSSPAGVHGGVRDANGDNDTLDTIAAYNGSFTRTYRPGVTTKINWQFANNKLTVGYWYEHARLIQTGPYIPFDANGNPADIWGINPGTFIRQADGQPIEFRDQVTVNTSKEPFVIDSLSLLNDKLTLVAGVKQDGLKRTFTNSANESSGSGADYVIQRNYTKLLPSFGATYHFTTEQSVYADGTKNFKAPANFVLGGLVQGGTVVNGVLQGFRLRDPDVTPETSWSYEAGYRYAGDRLTFSSALFLINFKNRISSAFDPTENLFVDTNVGGATIKGVELESAFKVTKEISVYGSASYTRSRMDADFNTSALIALPTTGKQIPGTPKWLGALQVQYTSGPFYAFVQGKYNGREFSTLVNDDSVPGYTLINLGSGYTLPTMGWLKGASITANLFNLTNKKYLSVQGTSGSSFRQNAFPVVTARGTANGSAVQYYVGSPITFAASLGLSF
jgi:iron complex outermembrane receptor protein